MMDLLEDNNNSNNNNDIPNHGGTHSEYSALSNRASADETQAITATRGTTASASAAMTTTTTTTQGYNDLEPIDIKRIRFIVRVDCTLSSKTRVLLFCGP